MHSFNGWRITLTKREILKELKKFGIDATLRPRKAVLVELLERVKKDHKEKKLKNNKVTFLDDVYEACKICPKMETSNLIMIVCCVILLSFFVLAALGVFN